MRGAWSACRAAVATGELTVGPAALIVIDDDRVGALVVVIVPWVVVACTTAGRHPQ